MSQAGPLAASALLGGVLGLGMAALVAVAGNVLSRLAGSLRGQFAAGTALRLAGALAGVVLGVRLKPDSVAALVLSFLAVYLIVQGFLLLRHSGS